MNAVIPVKLRFNTENPANSKTLGEKKIGSNFLTAHEENGGKMGL